MKREVFVDMIVDLVNEYINYGDDVDPDMMIRVNPSNLAAVMVDSRVMQQEIAYSDEAVEAAAGVEGDASESATDMQAREDPEFYKVKSLIITEANGSRRVSREAVERIADDYGL